MKKTEQLKVWEGDFGKAYTDRNAINYRVRISAFRTMVEDLAIKRVLEVGCNRGTNLLALAEILPDDSELIGIEPNRYALELAQKESARIAVLPGNVFDLPFKDSYFDLVFTAGVLIHVVLEDLSNALHEIYRVASRYILAIEYFAEEETPIHYRGYDNLLWKRNFPKHYLSEFPDLTIIRSGYWGPEHGFDRTHWWMFEK